MATVSISLPSDGTTADVADYNTPITTIATEFNGNIDNANIKTGAAIDASKLAAGTVGSVQLATGTPVQEVYAGFSAVATGSTLIPADDTLPQITEGNEYMTLAITPKSLTNILIIEVVALLSASGALYLSGALFQDANANALAAETVSPAASNSPFTMTLKYSMAAGTTSSTTFRFRAGVQSAGTVTFNGFNSTRLFNTAIKSFINIREIKA